MAGWAGYTMANEILDFFYRGQAISIGGSLYVRLLVETSSRSGGGLETNYAGYGRLTLLRGTTIFTAAANGRMSNSVLLAFASATSLGNGDLVAFDIVDTPSGAFTKVYNGGPVSPAKAIVVGKPPKFAANSLVFTF